MFDFATNAARAGDHPFIIGRAALARSDRVKWRSTWQGG